MTVTENTMIGMVKIPDNAQIQVTFTYTVGSDYNDYRSVLSIGSTVSERMPGVFISRYNKFVIYWNMDSESGTGKKTPSSRVEWGKKYSFHFYTSADRMTLNIKEGADDGDQIFSAFETGQQHKLGTLQPIYVGNNFLQPDGGVLENLIIREFKGNFNWWENPIILTGSERGEAWVLPLVFWKFKNRDH